MEKTWLINVVGFFILLITLVIIGITYQPPGFQIEEQSFYEERLEASGINKDLLIPTQMQPIAENEMMYIKTFHTEDYTGQTVNPIVFSRNWGSPIRADWDNESEIVPEVYLFENGEHYYAVIASFKVPYSFDTNGGTIGYLDIKHSNNFTVDVWYSISYLEDGIEQRIQSSTLSKLEGLDMFPIYQNTNPIFSGFNKDLIYTFIIGFNPSLDNDLDVDMYLSTDLDFYFESSSPVDTLQLGFNEFKLPENQSRYQVIRKTVRYRKEQ
jgi:hypothetical protein